MPLPDGLLVKSNSNPRVYVIETGQRHWIPDPYTLEFYGGWPAVNIVSDSDLNAIPEGARKPSRVPRTDGVLLKGTGPKVYVMDQGQKRWVPDPPTLVTLGGWSKVINIADQDLNTIPDGAPYPSAGGAAPQPIQLLIDLDSDLGANHYMTTHGALRPGGTIDAQTRTRSRTWFGGFRGGVQVFLGDVNGITIAQSQVHDFGVDGTAVGRADRTDYWSEQMDPQKAAQATALHVTHFWYPRYSFFDNLIQRAVAAARPAVALIQEIKANGGDAK